MQAINLTPEMKAAISLFHRRYAKAMMLVHDEASFTMLEQIREYFNSNITNNPAAFNQYAHENIAQIMAEHKCGAEVLQAEHYLFRLLDQFYIMASENAEREVASILSPEPTNGLFLKIVDEAARSFMTVFQNREQGKALLDAVINNPLLARRIFEKIGSTYLMRTATETDLKEQLYKGDRQGMRGQLSTFAAHDAKGLQKKAQAEEHLKTVAGAIQNDTDPVSAAYSFDGTILVHIFGIANPDMIQDISQRVKLSAPKAERVHALVYHGNDLREVRNFYRRSINEGKATFLKDELAKDAPKIMNLIVHPYTIDGTFARDEGNYIGYANAIQHAVLELGGTVYHLGLNQMQDNTHLAEAIGAATASVRPIAQDPEKQACRNYSGSVVLHFPCGLDDTNKAIFEKVRSIMPKARLLDYHYMNDRVRAGDIIKSALAASTETPDGFTDEVIHFVVVSSNNDLVIQDMILQYVRATDGMGARIREETFMNDDTISAALSMSISANANSMRAMKQKSAPEVNMVEVQQTIDNYDGCVVLHFVGEADPTIICEKMTKFHEAKKSLPVYMVDYHGTDVVRSHQHLVNQMDYLNDQLHKHKKIVHFIIAPQGIVVKDSAARAGVDSFEGNIETRVYLQAVAVGLGNLGAPVTVLDEERMSEQSLFLGNLAFSLKARSVVLNGSAVSRLHVSQAEVGSFSAEPKGGPETPMSVRLAFDGVLMAHVAGTEDPDQLQIIQSRLEAAIPNGRVMVLGYGCSDIQDDQQKFFHTMNSLTQSIIEGSFDIVSLVVPSKDVSMVDLAKDGKAQTLSKIINDTGIPAVIAVINDDVSDSKLAADVAFAIKQGKYNLSAPMRNRSFGVLSGLNKADKHEGAERAAPNRTMGEAEVGYGGLVPHPTTLGEASEQGREVGRIMAQGSADRLQHAEEAAQVAEAISDAAASKLTDDIGGSGKIVQISEPGEEGPLTGSQVDMVLSPVVSLRKVSLRMEDLSEEDRARLEADPKLKSIMEHHENIRENVIAITEQYLSTLPEEERKLIASMLGDNVVMSDAVQQMMDRGIIPKDAE